MQSRLSHSLSLLACYVVLAAGPDVLGQDAKAPPDEFKELKFRSIGPAAGGRVSRVAGVPGDPLVYYAGVSSGGVWKSTDGGISFKPIFDDQPTQAIGSLAVAPSDPNVIYVGSGEANIRGNVQPGNGIYRSTDGGKTWKHVWKQRGQIGAMIVHPKNPDIAFAAVLGHAFGPNEQRGIYRTLDGGKNWQRVLFKNQDAGASDVCFDPNNPRILFAGLWQTRRRPWELTSGGPGSGLYVSRDGGDSWTQLVAPKEGQTPEKNTKFCEGLPEGVWGRIAVGVARSDSQRIYALIEAEHGGLFRSDDGGDSWSLVNSGRALRQRAWYFTTLTIHPTSADIVFFPTVPLLKTIDGGKSLVRVKGPHHGDHHDLWIDPTNPERMIDANDGGVDVTSNGGKTWFAPPLPICQFYHVSCDSRTPYHVSGTIQDIGTASGPSNSLKSAGILLSDWHNVGGGETGFTASDPTDPNIVYAGEYGGFITRYDHRTRQARSIGIYPYDASGHAAAELKYRFQWTAPILMSPHDPKIIYHGANVLFKTTNAGQTWEKISPDLTRNDKSKQKWSGGPITGDNTGAEVYDTIFALAESPKQANLLWAGSDDGLVHVTTDGGKTWKNVTPDAMPDWGTVVCIEPSPFEANAAYVVVDAHRLDDQRPYLFHSTDRGKSWKSLTAGLADDAYLRAVREDPKKRGQLYLATSTGVMYSPDAGKTFKPLKLNLPAVQVCDLAVKDDDLVVATDGRSIWILDDLSPLRQAIDKQASLQLLAARPAYRYRYSSVLQEKLERGSADNPPEGAILHYWLKTKPKGDVVLEIFDDKDKLVRRLTSKEEEKEPTDVADYSAPEEEPKTLPAESGVLQRVVWDLRYAGAVMIKHAKIDSGNPKNGPLVNPGVYTLKLTADGKTATIKLEVRQDPRVQVPPAELAEQLALMLAIRDDITSLSHTVEQIRSVRRQIQTQIQLLKDDAKAGPFVKAGQAVLPKLDALEESLHNPRAKISYDILAQKGGAKVYSQLAWLFEQLKDSDGKPTEGMREVYAEQRKLLEAGETQWRELIAGELARLHVLSRSLDRGGIVLP